MCDLFCICFYKCTRERNKRLDIITMKNYIIGSALLLLPAFAHGVYLERINDNISLRNFSVVGYIKTYQQVLLNIAIDKIVNNGFAKEEAPELFRLLVTGIAISHNEFVPSENFSKNDYTWLVKPPNKLYILRSRNAGDINVTVEPKRLPNFDIKNPNFVVIDPERPVMDIENVMYIRLPNFLWNIDVGPRALSTELGSIFDEARKALYPTDSSSLSELTQNLLLLGI